MMKRSLVAAGMQLLQEVCLTTLYVSSKLHDTLKKPREIILASYALRYPHLLKGRLTIDPASVDQSMLERDRKRVLGIERLVLETICFNFRVGDRSAFKLVVKLSKALGRECNDHAVSQYCTYRRPTLFVPVSKAYTHLAWQVTADASVLVSTSEYSRILV
jgi:CTD kinase subunit beta